MLPNMAAGMSERSYLLIDIVRLHVLSFIVCRTFELLFSFVQMITIILFECWNLTAVLYVNLSLC